QSTLLAPTPSGPVEVEADEIVYQWEAQVIRLQGHVVVRREGALLRAGSGSLDRAHGVLKLEGGVLGVQARQVFLADAAIVDLNARSAELSKAVLFLKTLPANPDAPRAGANALTLHGARVRQLPDGGYAAEQVTITPCDCAGEPDYELIADRAEIEGDRARLHGVDLRFLRATIPLFPLSLPLTSRQSGLLAPQFGFAPSIGFTLVQPIFFTLGQSNDLTVTPGFYTGGTNHQKPAVPGARSVKGPHLGVEWRYAPVEGTAGSLALDLYQDLDQHDSPGVGSAFAGERGTSGGRGFGGVRGLLHLTHRSEGEPGVFAVQGVAATDAMAARDPQPNALESLQDFLRTDVGAWRARGPLTLGLDATLLQDVRLDQAGRADGPPTDRRLFGPEHRSTMQRLPGAFAQLAPVPLGPATFEVEASAVQFQRLTAPGAEERRTGFGPTDRGASPGLESLPYDGSRAPALRLDLFPRLGVSGPRTLPLDLRLEAGARLDSWIAEGFSDRNRTRAYALAGASAGLPLERRFGGLLHRVEPALAVRALSRPLQAGGPPLGDPTDAGGREFASAPDAAQQGLAPAAGIAGVPAARRAYDEIDFAAPASGAVEATASLSQSLWVKRGPVPGRIFQFDLLQDALLWTRGGRARLGEGSAVAGTQLGPASLGTTVRYDWALRALSAFGASGGVRDARGDEVHSSISFLRGSSSERLRAGIDELFSAARFDVPAGGLTGNLHAGASAALPNRNVRLAYELAWTPGTTPENFANIVHSMTVSWETPCKCAGLVLLLGYPFHDGTLLHDPSHTVFGTVRRYLPDFSFRIDLKALGSIGTF
ncbi:MAG TPA: hypothetical protein VFP52_01685, partial [Myxococcales bacterium]|nr:hypothetical protein [Myxococcales bacterium]